MRYYVSYGENNKIASLMKYPYENQEMEEISKEEYLAIIESLGMYDEELLTNEKKREQLYDTEQNIEWPVGSNVFITVTEAAKLWTYYTSEGNVDVAKSLTEKIASAKSEIRNKYPEK